MSYYLFDLYYFNKITYLLLYSAFSAIIPQKKPKGGRLNSAGRQRNKRVGHDRVPVENGFGRAQSLFGVLHHKYT